MKVTFPATCRWKRELRIQAFPNYSTAGGIERLTTLLFDGQTDIAGVLRRRRQGTVFLGTFHLDSWSSARRTRHPSLLRTDLTVYSLPLQVCDKINNGKIAVLSQSPPSPPPIWFLSLFLLIKRTFSIRFFLINAIFNLLNKFCLSKTTHFLLS